MKTNLDHLVEITDALEQKIRGSENISWDDIQHALNHITEENNQGLYGMVCYYAAFVMINQGKPDECLSYLNEGIRCLQGTELEHEVARCYNLSGIVAHSQGNYVLAMEHYKKARVYAEGHNSHMIAIMSIGNMANTYYRVGAYERALACYKECVQRLNEYGRNTVSAENLYRRILSGYGYCLAMTEQMDKANAVAEELLWADDKYINNSVKLAIFSFFAFFFYQSGETQRAELYVDLAVKTASDHCVIFTDFDNILNLIQYLIRIERFDCLQKVLDNMEPQAAIERNEGLLLQLLLIRLQYCSEEMDQESFLTCTQTFFRLKDKYEYMENNQVLRVISLRNKLRKIEEEQAKLEEENSKLRYQTEHDELSGLYNKRYLNRHMEDIFDEALQKELPLGVLFVDIDYFKQMNDRYGHQKGDDCIVTIAKAIKACMPGDFAARYGGDEFVIITLGRSREYLEERTQMLVDNIKARGIPNVDSGYMNIVTVTIGAVCAIPHKPNKMWDFLSAADKTLYQQKNEQRGTVRFYIGQDDSL